MAVRWCSPTVSPSCPDSSWPLQPAPCGPLAASLRFSFSSFEPLCLAAPLLGSVTMARAVGPVALAALVALALAVAMAAATPTTSTSTATAAQFFTNFTLSFGGGLPFCSQCGQPSVYACSPDAFGATLGQVRPAQETSESRRAGGLCARRGRVRTWRWATGRDS